MYAYTKKLRAREAAIGTGGVKKRLTSVHLKKNVERAGAPRLGDRHRRVNLLGKLERVDRLDAGEVGHAVHDQLALVGLKLADKPPPNVGGQRRRLAHQLLHVVLAKVPHAGVVRLLERLVRLGLGHRDEARRRAALARGDRQALLHGGQRLNDAAGLGAHRPCRARRQHRAQRGHGQPAHDPTAPTEITTKDLFTDGLVHRRDGYVMFATLLFTLFN